MHKQLVNNYEAVDSLTMLIRFAEPCPLLSCQGLREGGVSFRPCLEKVAAVDKDRA